MSKRIPLFPLNLVAFPGEKLRLHIFEPRYRQLVKDCIASDLNFGIVPVTDKKLHDIGTTVSIEEIVHAYPDGKMDISTMGLKAFELIDFSDKISDKLYPGGEIEELDDINDTNLLMQTKVFEKIEKLYMAMNMKISLPDPSFDYSIYEMSHKIGLSTTQEIELLGLRSELDRLEYIGAHLDKMIPVVNQMEEMRQKVQMNGHFKDALPPDFEL